MTQTLSTLLIPFHGGQLVMPESSVVEVLPYAPSLKIENAPRWVAGALLWKVFTVPLINMDRLIYELEDDANYGRIVIVNAHNDNPRLPYVGFLGSKSPRPISMMRDVIERDETATTESELGVLQRVMVQGRPAIIPDLNALEQQLVKVMRH